MPYIINTFSGGLVGPFPTMEAAKSYMDKMEEENGLIHALMTPKDTSAVEWLDLKQPDDKGFCILGEAIDKIMSDIRIEPYCSIVDINNGYIRQKLLDVVYEKFKNRKINLLRLKDLVIETFTGQEPVIEDEDELVDEYIKRCISNCTRLDVEVVKGDNS